MEWRSVKKDPPQNGSIILVYNNKTGRTHIVMVKGDKVSSKNLWGPLSEWSHWILFEPPKRSKK